jgi:hypothetical protein
MTRVWAACAAPIENAQASAAAAAEIFLKADI